MRRSVVVGLGLVVGGSLIIVGGLNGNLAAMLGALFDPSDLGPNPKIQKGSSLWADIFGWVKRALNLNPPAGLPGLPIPTPAV